MSLYIFNMYLYVYLFLRNFLLYKKINIYYFDLVILFFISKKCKMYSNIVMDILYICVES